METKTHNNNSRDVQAHDKKGHFFALATYGKKADEIHADKAALKAEAEAMETADLDARLLETKTAVKRLQDAESALAKELKERMKNGEEAAHFKLETYERMSGHDWKACAEDLKMTHAAFRVKYGNVIQVTSLKPKA